MARAMEGERGRPGLHCEHACDVELQAGHAHNAVAILNARSTMTVSLSELLKWNPRGLTDSLILVSINSQMSSS
jgi:hypothetical protein